MIDTKKDRKNLYLKLSEKDLISKYKSLLEKEGYKLRVEDGKFVPKNIGSAYDVPWIYVKTDPRARCDIFHKVFHQIDKYVHSYCRNCYKVVVRPRNLVELFDLYEVQRSLDVPCKCGIERRQEVHGLYGGYFYNRGLEMGIERLAQVRELVAENLSTETPVFLKRYCTEFEIGPLSLGRSDEMSDATKDEIEHELKVMSLFPSVGVSTPQSDEQIAHVMMSWIHWAYANGDETYKEFTDGNPLFDKYVTYERN